MSVLFNIVTAIIILTLAPLCIGIIKKLKAYMQNRRGFTVLQPYFDLWKLLHKSEVISRRTTALFRIAPYIYFMAIFTAASLLPLLLYYVNRIEIFLLVGLLAAARIALVLAAFDAGSSFAGIGAERELFFSILFEPALLVILFAKIYTSGTALSTIAALQIQTPLNLQSLLAAIAFFMLTVAESGRIPVDNPDTHLELTMVHEAMLLEYSGKRLALITWAAQMKQVIYVVIFAQIFIPWQLWHNMSVFSYWGVLLLKILFMLVALAVTETMTNKMRVFRVPGFMLVAIALAIFSIFIQ
ncbi:MAG: NADH-quinone oxidoreductase subunit H [Negativicutes bacterium]|jgi:formate hydrogenlyase subunit 4